MKYNLTIIGATAAAVFLAAYFGFTLLAEGTDKTFFLPSRTSDGHHQLERKCELCHLPFDGTKETGCKECHEEELNSARDSHPEKIFKDPRNAEDLQKINALSCRTCHKEHLEDSYADGLTVPADFCIHCHKDVTQKRPTHKNLEFSGCRDCHNYHDNTALYEDFLEKHLDEPETLEQPVLPKRNFLEFYKEKAEVPVQPLSLSEADAPAESAASAEAQEWAASSHAQAGVNCTACHSSEGIAWQDQPDPRWCGTCHEDEQRGFLAGKHGLRQGLDMPPMTVAEARRTMRKSSEHKTLTCFSCHPAHRFDAAKAAAEACLTCHADQHSLAYKKSAHFRLWQDERAGSVAEGKGVSCASCHLPRTGGGKKKKKGKKRNERIKVEHNQSANLEPNQKMIRTVCQNCHGLQFILDSLADKKLVEKNFSEPPRKRIKSLEMVKERQQQD